MKFSDFKIKEEAAGVGIVTKQNATKDVPVGGEYNNVSKLGLGKGKPKKHKTKSVTNVAFNLGMAEGKDTRKIKPRDPNAQAMQDIRRSGASGAHKDKKKDMKQGKQKHKGNIGIDERSLSKGEEKEKERIVKGMKKAKGDFKDRYGKDADAVMYATATKLAKNESVNEVTIDDISSASEIYVDMDGVLVDFFSKWTEIMGVDHWKQIDDVPTALQKIRDTKDFWINLKPTPNADNLLSIIKKIRGEYNILSAPMADDPRVEPSKREWVKNNLKAFPPKKVIITADKAKYATQPDGTPNVLIDDFGQNVNKWTAAGGIGFKHKDHKFERTAKNLQQHFNEPVEEGIGNVVKATAEFLAMPITMIPAAAKAAPLIQKALDTNNPKLFGQAMEVMANARVFRKHPKILKFYIKLGKKLAQTLAAANPDMKDFDWEDMKADIKQQTGFDLNQYESVEEARNIPNPKNTWAIDSDAPDYDFMRMGRTIANPDTIDPEQDRNPTDPDLVISFFGGDKEAKAGIELLKKLGYDVNRVDGYQDTNYDPEPTNGKAPPQIKQGQKLGKLSMDKIKPVQKDRSFEKLDRQYDRVKEGTYAPIIVDKHGRIVNGHHRFDALRILGADHAVVEMLDDSIENILGYYQDLEENFVDGITENKINFTMPNFDFEWEEANRYEQYRVLGKEKWIKLAKTGKAIDVDNRMANDIENTEAGEEHRYDYWDGLVQAKRDRFTKALSSGQIELPIIARYSDGQMELISGNTRLTGMMRELGRAKAWVYDVPDEVADLEENFADGKKPGRKGQAKRSGVNCKKSVTALRKIAKNSSGEKRRMAHWCANMKSGRKKG